MAPSLPLLAKQRPQRPQRPQNRAHARLPLRHRPGSLQRQHPLRLPPSPLLRLRPPQPRLRQHLLLQHPLLLRHPQLKRPPQRRHPLTPLRPQQPRRTSQQHRAVLVRVHRDRATTRLQAHRVWASVPRLRDRVTTRSQAHRAWASARPRATFPAPRHRDPVHRVRVLRVQALQASVREAADSSAPVAQVAPQVAVSSVQALRPLVDSSAQVALQVLPARTLAPTAPQAAAVVVVAPVEEPLVHSAVVAERASHASRSAPRGRNSNSGKLRRLVA